MVAEGHANFHRVVSREIYHNMRKSLLHPLSFAKILTVFTVQIEDTKARKESFKELSQQFYGLTIAYNKVQQHIHIYICTTHTDV